MWKTFINEFKWVRKSPWRIIEFLIIIFIPTIYGFLYLNAYWNPFQNLDQLSVVVVNNDNDIKDQIQSNKLVKNLVGKKNIKVGAKNYNINLKEVYDVTNPKKYIDQNKADAIISIPKNYVKEYISIFQKKVESKIEKTLSAKNIGQLLNDYFNKVIKNKITFKDFLITKISDQIDINKIASQLPKLNFFNSYKHNFFAGEITNFGASLFSLSTIKNSFDFDLIIKNIISKISSDLLKNSMKLIPLFEKELSLLQDKYKAEPDILSVIKIIKNNPIYLTQLFSQTTSGILKKIDNLIDNLVYIVDQTALKSNLINYKNIGGNISTYGFGLSPYFISIAMWAGALVMLFLFKNVRRKNTKDISTLKHYLGKSMVWIVTSFIQATILMSAITLQGVNIGSNQWMLYLFTFFIGFIFTILLQAIGYFFRYGDLAEFIAVILLVIQLTSSSGTFPAKMQSKIFRVLNPIIPFTYTISAIREIFYQPDPLIILKNCGILLIFLFIVPISIFVNYLYDKKHRRFNVYTKKYIYPSYEIHLGDR